MQMTYFSFNDHDATQSECMTSEFEKKNIYIYIKSSDQALDSYKEKGIHWILKLGNLCYIE